MLAHGIIFIDTPPLFISIILLDWSSFGRLGPLQGKLVSKLKANVCMCGLSICLLYGTTLLSLLALN